MKMRMSRIGALVAFMAVCVAAVAQPRVTPAILNRADSRKMNEWVEQKFHSMSQDEKIAQIILLTIEPKDNAVTRKVIDKYVGGCKIGGLLFSKGSCIDEANVINYAQSVATVPLMITLDGEWGLSMRMPEAPLFPRNMILGAVTDDRLLYEYGKEVARECRAMGITVNFAPVLDVNDNPKNPVIGNRSFGEMPERVASLGIAYSKGLEDNGVLTTAKHFPGHGSTSTDSHKTLPVVKKSMRELNLCELVPFRRYAEAGLSGVMVGHLSVPAIDKSGVPTSSSAKTINLLRNDLGFEGLVFTDAMTMSGAKTGGSAVVNSLLAGVDVMLSPANIESEIKMVKAAVASGKVPQSLVDAKCKKMLRYKYALGLNEPKCINTKNLVGRISTPGAATLIRRLWAGAMTVIKNDGKPFPVRHLERKKIAVVTMGDVEGVNSMFQNRCAMYTKTYRYSYKAGENYSKLEAQLKEGNYDMVIVGVHNSTDAYRTVLASMASKIKNISVAMFVDPYKAQRFSYAIKHCKGVLVAYDDNNIAQDYAAQTIFGGNGASGVLPVTITNVAKAGTGIFYKSTRLGYTLPEEVGVSSKLLSKVDSISKLGLKLGAYTGLQVLVARHGKVICNRNYGYTDNTKSRVPVETGTVFDLASVSKATGTLAGIMKCYDQGKFELDDKLSKFVPGLRDGEKEDLTFQDFLFHETGLPASLNMFYMMFNPNSYNGALLTGKPTKLNTIKIQNGAYGNKEGRLRTDILSRTESEKFDIAIAKGLYGGKITTDSIMQRIYNVKVRSNRHYLYSCLNFCLLMDAEQRMTKMSHDKFVNQQIFAPLGACNTGYRPLEWTDAKHIVATEKDTYLRRQMLQGYVHDELAAFMGGVSGNAGLFSSANDLAKLFQMWLNGGKYGDIRFLKNQTVRTFLTTTSDNSRRGLGFDKPDEKNPNNSPCSKNAPAEVVGHTGFSGTCFWIDPKNDMIYIFLSNRICPTRDNKAFAHVSARSHIQAEIYNAIII